MAQITVDFYGRPTEVRIIARHPLGTVDVRRVDNGKCYRVSGLPLSSGSAHKPKKP